QQQLRRVNARRPQGVPAVRGQLAVLEDAVAAVALGQGLVEEVAVEFVARVPGVAAQLRLAEEAAGESARAVEVIRIDLGQVHAAQDPEQQELVEELDRQSIGDASRAVALEVES